MTREGRRALSADGGDKVPAFPPSVDRSGGEVRLDTPPLNFGGRAIESYLKWRESRTGFQSRKVH